jgi:hypothetical protein
MNQAIFKNTKTLSTKDIILQFTIPVGILTLIAFIVQMQGTEHTPWPIFILSNGIILTIGLIVALTEKTLKSVEIDVNDNRILFVVNRHFNNDKTFDFQLKTVSLDITTKPDRSLPPNKILTIKDDNSRLSFSSRQKGLSEQTFMDIIEKVKHYPQQTAIMHAGTVDN